MLFRTDSESILEMSLVGGTRNQKESIINNSPNSELVDSGKTCLMIEICLLEEGRSGICEATVAGGERF